MNEVEMEHRITAVEKLTKGNEPEGSYEEMGAAVPLTEAEAALAELEAVYDAG